MDLARATELESDASLRGLGRTRVADLTKVIRPLSLTVLIKGIDSKLSRVVQKRDRCGIVPNWHRERQKQPARKGLFMDNHIQPG